MIEAVSIHTLRCYDPPTSGIPDSLHTMAFQEILNRCLDIIQLAHPYQ